MRKLVSLVIALLTPFGALLAACTATKQNAMYSPVVSGASSISANVHAVGDLVAITAWCFPNCTNPQVTLGAQTAVQTTVSGADTFGNTGQGFIFYVLSAAALGSQPITFTQSGAPTQTQVSYIDFTPSAGCTFSHDVDSPMGTGTGLSINTPSITPKAGDLLVNFTYITQHVTSVLSPWSCPVYPSPESDCFFNTTKNAAAYILSATSGSTANSMTNIQITDHWEALITSFTMMSSSTQVHYISKSTGSDSNSGISKAAPWAHLPGMQSCSSFCASYTPVAGDQFILYGGDTWTGSDLGVVWNHSGTSGAPIYIGVDQSWYNGGVCGASFCRPIFNCNGTACAGTGNAANFMYVVGSYVTVDNIEFKGLYNTGGTGSAGYVKTELDHDIVENCYFHGWTIAAGATQDFGEITAFEKNNFSPFTSVGSGLFYSVIDGTDASTPSMVAVYGEPDYIVGNYIKNVTNGAEVMGGYLIHDNYITTIPPSYQAAAHQNAIQVQHPANSHSSTIIYKNVVTDVRDAGIVKYWWAQDASNSGTTNYVFNNVLYNVVPGNNVNVCQLGTACGTHYVFNNTWECGNDSSSGDCMGPGATPTGTVQFINNHCVTSGLCLNNSGHSFTATETTDLLQTVSVANGQGYTSGSPYAFQPTSANGGTVATGTNMQSICTAIAAIDSPSGVSCQNDTSYACTYKTSNHTMTCPARTAVARPASGAWDVGGFQFSSSQGQTVAPPIKLVATVQ